MLLHAALPLAALLSLAATPTTASLAPAHDPAPLEYHAHTAFLRNGTALTKRAAAASCPALSSEGQLIAAYVPAWTNGATKTVPWDDVDMAFWFCTLTSAGGIELAPGMSISAMQDFVSTAKAAGSTPLLTVGGWSGSVYFSSLVSSTSSRASFASVLKTWVDDYGFAGVDLDWEFVGRQGAGNNIVSSKDAENYVAFLKVLRQTLGTDKLIAGAVPASGINGADGSILTDTTAFAQYFDYIVLMAYDFYGAWSSTTGPNAALHTCNAGSDSAEATIDRWLASGFPACKMLLGVPSYSHSFSTASSTLSTTTYNGKKTTAFQTQGSGTTVEDGTTVAGLIAAGYLSADLSKGAGGYTRYYDSCTETPFLFNPSTKSWITYDDEQSWAAKAAMAKAKNLAGVAVYESTGPTAPMWSALVANLDRAPECSASNDCADRARPSNSNAFCNSGVCGFRCRSGFTLTDGACLSTATTTTTTTTTQAPSSTTTTSAPAATATCSASNDCADQARPANSNAFCKSGLCSFRCRSGFTLVGDSCISTASTTSAPVTTTTTTAAAPTQTCSASNDCADVDRPANSNAYCRSGVCSFRCRSGFTLSGDSCLSTATTTTTTAAAPSVQTCAASNDCTNNSRPANSNAYCKSGTCSFRCRSGYTLSGSSTCVASSARRFAQAKRSDEGYAYVDVQDGALELFGGELKQFATDETSWAAGEDLELDTLLD
ncbi:hypothetical protein JCM6882_007959 [Rhodosporidiobolus microsporus]